MTSLSLFFFAGDAEVTDEPYALVLECGRLADRLGFEAIWTPERHFHRFGGLYPNPSVISAALAVTTERVALRAGSVVLPLHDPLRVVEEWSVVDHLSRGRVGLSFASGWQPADFVLRPQAFERRRESFREDIVSVLDLWQGGSTIREDPSGEEVRLSPFPPRRQASLPFWVTAAQSPTTFQMAGELGGGILTHLLTQSLDELTDKIALYRAAHPGTGHVTLMMHTLVASTTAEALDLAREPLHRYLENASDLLLASLGAGDLDRSRMTPRRREFLIEGAFRRYAQNLAQRTPCGGSSWRRSSSDERAQDNRARNPSRSTLPVGPKGRESTTWSRAGTM